MASTTPSQPEAPAAGASIGQRRSDWSPGRTRFRRCRAGSGTDRMRVAESSMISEPPPPAPQPSAIKPFVLVPLKDGPIDNPAGPPPAPATPHPVAPGKMSYAATTLAYWQFGPGAQFVRGVQGVGCLGSEILRTNPSVVAPPTVATRIENPEPVPPRTDAAAVRESPTVYPKPGVASVTVVTGPPSAATGIENPEPPGMVAERVSPILYPLPGLTSVTTVTLLPATVMFAVAPAPVPPVNDVPG